MSDVKIFRSSTDNPLGIFVADLSLALAYYLWLAGTAGIYLMGFVVLTHISRHQEIKLAQTMKGVLSGRIFAPTH